MHYQLATRFGRNAHQISGREPLDNEALYRHVPSIFAREAHDSRSDRYVYVPTIDIVEGLRREGWFPFFAVQSAPRDGSRHGHAKHMLRLRRDDGIGPARHGCTTVIRAGTDEPTPRNCGRYMSSTSGGGAVAGSRSRIRSGLRGGVGDTISFIAHQILPCHPRRICQKS